MKLLEIIRYLGILLKGIPPLLTALLWVIYHDGFWHYWFEDRTEVNQPLLIVSEDHHFLVGVKK